MSLSCAVAGESPPPIMPESLGAVGQGLIRNALDHAFPNGRGGRVAISFEAEAAEWRLVVEHSGAARGPLLDGGLDRVRVLVAALEGRLEAPRVIGGTRWVVFVPRP